MRGPGRWPQQVFTRISQRSYEDLNRLAWARGCPTSQLIRDAVHRLLADAKDELAGIRTELPA
jgi:hypothetical protein